MGDVSSLNYMYLDVNIGNRLKYPWFPKENDLHMMGFPWGKLSEGKGKIASSKIRLWSIFHKTKDQAILFFSECSAPRICQPHA